MKLYSEKEILQLLQSENTQRKAFEQIVKQYSQQLYWQIRRMVFSHDDANDLLQDTFIKAWQNIDSFRGDSKFTTWLYRIAINECISFLKKQHQSEKVDLDAPEADISLQLESDSYFDGDEIQLKLQKALASLPPKQRMVFNMKYYQDMKYGEISDLLGTSVGALKASYHLAVKKIEQLLNEMD